MSVSANPNKDTNILDLVLTNVCDMVSSIQIVDGIRGSNHNAVDFVIMKLLRKRKRTVYNFNKADWDLMMTSSVKCNGTAVLGLLPLMKYCLR